MEYLFFRSYWVDPSCMIAVISVVVDVVAVAMVCTYLTIA